MTASVTPRVMRRPSYDMKKNVLSFPLVKTGPPSPKRKNGNGPLKVPPKLL